MFALETAEEFILGTAVQVRLRKRRDHTVIFEEITAGKPEQRTSTQDPERWARKLFDALKTVR